MTPRTKLLIINSPANPTGAVYPRQIIEHLVDFCVRHDLYLLSDECYDQIIFEGECVSPASLVRDARIISAYTFSKTYAMTGWRVGYVVANASLTKAIRKIIEGTTACVSPICQRAAEAALTGPQHYVDEMCCAYQERRDIAVKILKQHNMFRYQPQGAFYIMVDINHFGSDSRSFALGLLKERSIAVAPGTAFGQAASCFVRVSLASSLQHLQVGLNELCKYVQSHS